MKEPYFGYLKIDILINNAGFQHVAPIEEFPTAVFQKLVQVMLTGAFIGIKHVFPIMKAQKYGRIINMASINGLIGFAGKAAYNSAKHGVIGLTKVAALETAEYGITVNAIAPGYFATELNTALLEDKEFTAWVERRTPSGRWAKPEELGGAVIFLASGAASYVNGHVLAVDGGISVSL